MSSWSLHSLAEPLPGGEPLWLRVGERVRARVDLPGVPVGTPGRVMLANGFEWPRYWVDFGEGRELGHLDGRHLEPRSAR